MQCFKIQHLKDSIIPVSYTHLSVVFACQVFRNESLVSLCFVRPCSTVVYSPIRFFGSPYLVSKRNGNGRLRNRNGPRPNSCLLYTSRYRQMMENENGDGVLYTYLG